MKKIIHYWTRCRTWIMMWVQKIVSVESSAPSPKNKKPLPIKGRFAGPRPKSFKAPPAALFFAFRQQTKLLPFLD
jgi:hypothetical protein